MGIRKSPLEHHSVNCRQDAVTDVKISVRNFKRHRIFAWPQSVSPKY